MTDNFTCPFCNSNFPLIDKTYRYKDFTFDNIDRSCHYLSDSYPEEIKIEMFNCPSCKQITVKTLGLGKQYPEIGTNIFPNSLAKQYPDYIPLQILEDYKEAYAIVNLSPKASATLSRRALQGMIRDFWKVSKNTLFDELKEIENKLSSSEKIVLNNLRKIGNIGAHPEKDINLIVNIEDGEAEKLLKVIEYFIKRWYIDRYETEQLFSDISSTNDKLQNQRKQ